MEKKLQRELMVYWAEEQGRKKQEKRVKGIAEEIAELIFWGISVGGGEKKVQVHKEEKKNG